MAADINWQSDGKYLGRGSLLNQNFFFRLEEI